MQPEDDVEDPNACSLILQRWSCNQAICVSIDAEPVINFHCGYARKMAVELLKVQQLFYYFKFGSCFVALSVLRQVWIGPVREEKKTVHGMTSCMIGMVEPMNLRPVMAWQLAGGSSAWSARGFHGGNGIGTCWHTGCSQKACAWDRPYRMPQGN